MNLQTTMFQLILDQTPEDRYQKYVIFCHSIKMTEAIQGLHYNAVCCNPLDGGLMIDQIEQMILESNGLLDHKVICCGSRDFNQQMQTFLHDNNRSYIDNGWKMLSNKDYLADSGRDEDLDQAIRQFIDKYDPEIIDTTDDILSHRLTASVLLDAIKNEEEPIRIRHFPRLSERLKLRPETVTVISAKPGSGKSALALNMAHSMNIENPVLYFNVEMSERIVYKRLLAIDSGLLIRDIEKFNDQPEIRETIESSAERLASRKPFVAYHNVSNIKEIERIITDFPRDPDAPLVVFIDHLHLIKNEISDLRQRFTQLAIDFHAIAKREHIILVLLAQQNRNGQEGRPTLASLKESGELENSADNVMFLWEKKPTGVSLHPEEDTKLLLAVEKNREGLSGEKYDIEISFDRPTQTISETGLEQIPDAWLQDAL